MGGSSRGSGAARGRARRLPGAARGAQSASRLHRQRRRPRRCSDRENTYNLSFELEESSEIRASGPTIRLS